MPTVRPILAALALLALAPAARAETVQDVVVGVIREHGCFLSEAEAEVVFPRLGLRAEQVLEVVEGMVARGEARRDDAEMTLVLSSGLCTIEEVRGEIRGALIAALRGERLRPDRGRGAGLARGVGVSVTSSCSTWASGWSRRARPRWTGTGGWSWRRRSVPDDGPKRASRDNLTANREGSWW
jgi:hypothetical protein